MKDDKERLLIEEEVQKERGGSQVQSERIEEVVWFSNLGNGMRSGLNVAVKNVRPRVRPSGARCPLTSCLSRKSD